MRELAECERPKEPSEDFDDLALMMTSSETGVVLLFELLPPWPLQMHWLDHQVQVLLPTAVRKPTGDSVLAVLLPDEGVADGWQLKEQLRERAAAQHITVFAGLACWPAQGSTPMDVMASAAAALQDELRAFRESQGDEVELELDGHRLALGAAGEFLTG